MFYKRDKGTNKNARLSSQYEATHNRNKNWMNQSGKDSAFTAYNSIRHSIGKSVSSSGNSSNFSKINDFKTSVRDSKKEISGNLKETKELFSGSFKMLKSSLKDTVKTGKIYSKEREEEASKKGMKAFGFDMDEMNFEDFDFGDEEEVFDTSPDDYSEDIEQDELPKKKEINSSKMKLT